MNTNKLREQVIITVEQWVDGSPTCLSIAAFDGDDAYLGTQPLPKEKPNRTTGVQVDHPDFHNIIRSLEPVPKQHIYPAFPPGGLSEFDRDDYGTLHLKRPNIHVYRNGDAEADDTIAKVFLAEAEINEQLLQQPHPNLAPYLGCVVRDGLITRLAFRQYRRSLSDRVYSAKQAADFPAEERETCMDQIEAAAEHLHQLGLAHNDISPGNIMFDESNTPVLIDLDSCVPLGRKLTKGGCVAGWRGPIADDNGPTFTTSTMECDRLAITYIRGWLMDEFRRIEGDS
ncbi:protein kinase-like domain-containing protein [Xylariomycetidae sp. FL2044]|nr:protein kinase-like domain-containing protein [Xylariomycetidae sp. FL2044]